MRISEKCGVIASLSFKGDNVFYDLYWGLVALNHRGHESYGITLFKNSNGKFESFKGLGLISHLTFEKVREVAGSMTGYKGVGHVRYATSSGSSKKTLKADIQPQIVGRGNSKIVVAYNGNIIDFSTLKEELKSRGFIFRGASDSEVLAYKLVEGLIDTGDLVESVSKVMEEVDGAYSVVGMTGEGSIFTFRDPNGIRPLALGLDYETKFMVASESVALDINRVPYLRSVKPGELIIASTRDVEYYKLRSSTEERLCAFEYAYFARPDSKLQTGRYVYEVRIELGRHLARRGREIASRIDVVVPVPLTAIDAAYGFHEETGIPIEPIIVRNRYVIERAFIMPSRKREEVISKKYNMLRDKLWGKRVALIDDSIVRGDTLKSIVRSLKSAGAREVHVFSTFPKITSPCFYGVDMTSYCELIGFKRDDEEIASIIGADTVTYQKISDFYNSIGCNMLCLGCVTGDYPTPKAQYYARKGLEVECGD